MQIVTLIIAVVLLFLGVVINKLTLVELIAGYDAKRVTDKKGLARWVGSHLTAMGGLGFITWVVGFLFPALVIFLQGFYFIAIVALAIRTASGTKHFEK